MHARRLSRLGWILGLAVASITAAATYSREAPCGDVKEAEEHFLKGKALLKAGDVPGAYKEYKASWDLKRTYDIAANLGNIELELSKPRDAAEHLAFAADNVAVSVSADRVEKIRSLLAKAKALVGAVKVKVNVDGAEVLVDGKSVGRAPLVGELYMDPGKHVLEAKLSPYTPGSESLDVTMGSTKAVELKLVLPGSLTSATASSSAAPPVPPKKSLLPVVIGGGAAVVGLGLGVVGAAVSGAKGGDIDRLKGELHTLDTGGGYSVCARKPAPASCAELADAYKAQGSFRSLAIVGFVTAGVATLATVTYVVLPGPKPVQNVQVGLGAGPGGGGVTIAGHF